MAMNEILVIVGEAGAIIGLIVALLIVEHHILRKWEMMAMAKTIKETMIPEIEQMSEKIIINTVDVTMKKSKEMTEEWMKWGQ